MGRRPTGREAEAFGEAEGEVHALHGRAGGALGEVVDGADGDQPAGGLVDGHLEVHGVGADAPTWSAATGPAGSRCTNGSSAYALA